MQRLCDVQDCNKPAKYRAPYSREHLDKYYWFCLEHVRQYNAGWNYYKGMNESEIENAVDNEPLGFRPTRPFSAIDKGNFHTREKQILESLRQFMYFRAYRAKNNRRQTYSEDIPTLLKKPLNVLGLHWPLTYATLRSRYYTLVKIYHPDRKQTKDEVSEEHIKQINTAFSTIKKYLREKYGDKL